MKGSCHCGAVTLELTDKPEYLFDCNCSLCGKLGVIWGYFEPGEVMITGETQVYTRVDREQPVARIHFCESCGCTTHWTPMPHIAQGRMGANMRLFSAEELAGVPLHFPDGKGWSGDGAFTMRQESAVY